MIKPFKFSKWGTIQAMVLSIMEAEMQEASCGALTFAISEVLGIDKSYKRAQGHLMFRARWRTLVSSMRRLNSHLLAKGKNIPAEEEGSVASTKLESTTVNLRELLKLMDGGTAACTKDSDALESCVEEWTVIRAALCNRIAVSHPDYKNTSWT